MFTHMHHRSSRRRRQTGQGLVEYALILTLVAIVVIASLALFGNKLAALYQCVASNLEAMNPGEGGSVRGFELVDPSSGTVIRSLGCIDSFDSGNYTITALTIDPQVKSVYFELDGPITNTRTENIIPWSLFGDTSGSYAGRTLPAGEYTLTATPYSEENRGGVAGPTFTVIFTVN
ncbi:MAG: hypothetical protein KC546_11845 [Anaerolineae bacterium]|nr:hypothetical protein [Anaerolineae bacterium]MCA9889061.1 hypothetical protein [Anaerolineae bacterium]MCA9895644.1 hypothetical protein [Anaerolineae bacterium]MCB9461517.1 hypothetical protein [Anaerolineaceae bacterium]